MARINLEVVKNKSPKQWSRTTIRLVGVWLTVQGKNQHYEPSGRYDCWVGTHLKTKHIQEALKTGKSVDAVIKMIENRPTVIRFETLEPEPFVEDIATQRAEYEELGGRGIHVRGRFQRSVSAVRRELPGLHTAILVSDTRALCGQEGTSRRPEGGSSGGRRKGHSRFRR